MSVSGGAITVPVTFQASHDAFAVYLTPAGTGGSGQQRRGDRRRAVRPVPRRANGSSTTNGTQTQL